MIEKLAEEPDTLAQPCCGAGSPDNSSMRSILLRIADDDSLERRTQAALDLARAFGSHLTCLQAVGATCRYGRRRMACAARATVEDGGPTLPRLRKRKRRRQFSGCGGRP
jgi:hypothetical protein